MTVVDGRNGDEKGLSTRHGKMMSTDFKNVIIFPRNSPALYTSLVPFLVTTHVYFFFIPFVVLLGILNDFQLINSVKTPWHIFFKRIL